MRAIPTLPFLLTLLLAIAQSETAKADQLLFLSPDDCKALSAQLTAIEQDYKKELGRFVLRSDLLADYRRYRVGVMESAFFDDGWWSSDAAAIAVGLRGLAKGTMEAAGMAAPVLGKIVAGAYTVIDLAIEAKRNGLPSKQIAEEVVKYVLVKLTPEAWKPLTEAVGLFYSKADIAADLVKDRQSRDALAKTVQEAVGRIDAGIARLQLEQSNGLKAQETSFKAKAAIESVLREAKCQ